MKCDHEPTDPYAPPRHPDSGEARESQHTPLPIHIIRTLSLIPCLLGLWAIGFSLWAVTHPPESDLERVSLQVIRSVLNLADTSPYGYHEALNFVWQTLISVLPSSLVILFSFRKWLTAMQIVLIIQMAFVVSKSGTIPVVPIVVFALTFLPDSRKYLGDSAYDLEASATRRGRPEQLKP